MASNDSNGERLLCSFVCLDQFIVWGVGRNDRIKPTETTRLKINIPRDVGILVWYLLGIY